MSKKRSIVEWKKIVNSIDIEIVPLELTNTVKLYFKDGRQQTIDIKAYRNSGLSGMMLDDMLHNLIEPHQHSLKYITCNIDYEAVADTIEPMTKKLFEDPLP